MGSVSWWFKWQSVRDGEAPTLPALELFFGVLSYSNTLTCSVWWLQGGGDSSTWQIPVLHVWPASLKRKERKLKNHLCWKINLFIKQKWRQFSVKAETWDCEDEHRSRLRSQMLSLHKSVIQPFPTKVLRRNIHYLLGLHSAPFLKVKLITVYCSVCLTYQKVQLQLRNLMIFRSLLFLTFKPDAGLR